MTTCIQRPTLEEVEAAADVLDEVLVPTPLVPLSGTDRGNEIWLKPEIHQRIGSFKIRGVYHAVAQLSQERRAAGLSTVSAGNTAQALAWCGRWFGVEARSLMPETAPQVKIDAVRALGGTPVLVPMAEVFRFLKEHGWENESYAFIHPWIERQVLIGHATLGLEIAAEPHEIKTVYIPVGGGGLLAGVASALRAVRPEVRIVAVEPAGCPALERAVQAGHPVTVPCDTLCDGVAVPYITDQMYPLLVSLIDDVKLVSEKRVRETIRRLAGRDRIVAEGSGALAVAAAEDAQGAGPAVAIVTGGSIDLSKLSGILGEG